MWEARPFTPKLSRMGLAPSTLTYRTASTHEAALLADLLLARKRLTHRTKPLPLKVAAARISFLMKPCKGLHSIIPLKDGIRALDGKAGIEGFFCALIL